VTDSPTGPSQELTDQHMPESFFGKVKDALEHVLDLQCLAGHSLGADLGLDSEEPRTAVGQLLRQELISAIDSLLPEKRVPFRSPQARRYHLLRLHYLQGMTVDEAAHELAISSRQAYRDLRRGEVGVAEVLWGRRLAPRSVEQSLTQVLSVQAEIARLESQPRPTNISVLLRHAERAVARIAEDRGLKLRADVPESPVAISTDPLLARQVLIGMLSSAVQQAEPGVVHVTLLTNVEGITLRIEYQVGSAGSGLPAIAVTTLQLADKLGWGVTARDHPDGLRAVTVRAGSGEPTVLVIDDNAGLVRLLRRYLRDQTCRVADASTGHEGLRLAQEIGPDAIVLDIMMPEMDGWDLLQRLQNHPKTSSIPVIVCSVINDPVLAYSLGATHVIAKPVNRSAILDALVHVGVL